MFPGSLLSGSYVLHTTAANIVLLNEAHRAMK